MAEDQHEEHLKNLRDLLRKLKSGHMQLVENGQDVTQSKIGPLELDIAYLERVVERSKAG